MKLWELVITIQLVVARGIFYTHWCMAILLFVIFPSSICVKLLCKTLCLFQIVYQTFFISSVVIRLVGENW